MTVYLLAGGGTAGHVNPLLATADRLRERDPDAQILVLGTAEGLEARLVPERGYELLTIPRLPFPRRPGAAALRFPARWRRAVGRVRALIRDHGVDAVVGFGGYASAPAYRAAALERIPLVVHEANARPGLANRLGARWTRFVGTTFPDTPLRGARLVGLPLRREIEQLDRDAGRADAITQWGLDPERPLLLITGGSTGARRINETVAASAAELTANGWQLLHITGSRSPVADPGLAGYHILEYCDRMELALAAADFGVSRAGAATVCEIAAVGLPSVLVPYPVGNGEQELNARGLVERGGAVLVADAAFTPEWVRTELVPLLADAERRAGMAEAVREAGVRDGADRMVDLVLEAVGSASDG